MPLFSALPPSTAKYQLFCLSSQSDMCNQSSGTQASFPLFPACISVGDAGHRSLQGISGIPCIWLNLWPVYFHMYDSSARCEGQTGGKWRERAESVTQEKIFHAEWQEWSQLEGLTKHYLHIIVVQLRRCESAWRPHLKFALFTSYLQFTKFLATDPFIYLNRCRTVFSSKLMALPLFLYRAAAIFWGDQLCLAEI